MVTNFSGKYQKYEGTFWQDEGVGGSPLPENAKILKVPLNFAKVFLKSTLPPSRIEN